MDFLFKTFLPAVVNGGPEAIIALLLIAVIALLVERRRLLKEVATKDEKIDKILEDYTNGNLTLTEALTNLKIVLYEIKGKLR